jgi:nucleoside-diphosphate-sugar epimerase
MITGGTGFAGSHTVRRFLELGHSVRMLVRDREKVRRVFDPFDIGFDDTDLIEGDIVDESAVDRAMQGCDAVYHGAALVDMRRSMAEKVIATNRRGVELVVGGAVERGLPSIVYVSSMSVFFKPGSGPLHLDMPVAPGTTAYAQSKAMAEHEIHRMQQDGAPIRASYPTGILGPDDPGMSNANHALYTFFNDSGINTSSGFQLVDVRDLATLHAKLLELPEAPHRYIAAGPMLDWPATYALLEEITGVRVRQPPIPGALLRVLGSIGDAVKHFYDFSFPMTRDAMEYATRWPGCSGERTTRELGLEFRSARETYTDTLRWMFATGHLGPEHVGGLVDTPPPSV